MPSNVSPPNWHPQQHQDNGRGEEYVETFRRNKDPNKHKEFRAHQSKDQWHQCQKRYPVHRDKQQACRDRYGNGQPVLDQSGHPTRKLHRSGVLPRPDEQRSVKQERSTEHPPKQPVGYTLRNVKFPAYSLHMTSYDTRPSCKPFHIPDGSLGRTRNGLNDGQIMLKKPSNVNTIYHSKAVPKHPQYF